MYTMTDTDKYFGLSKRIAKWKEPSEFESKLASCAESDPNIKSLYADYYKSLNPEYYQKGYDIAHKMYLSHIDEYRDISFDELYIDLVYCLHRYGFSFDDYFIFNLRDKSESARKKFVSDKLRYYYCDLLNDDSIEQIMTDKFACYQHYQPFYKREVIRINSAADQSKFIDFISRHKRVICKPIGEHSGHGIKILNIEEINPSECFNELLEHGECVIEEVITQGDALAQLNPTSVNTCRFTTFTINHEVEVIACTLRMGVGKNQLDNAGLGGIYASVDPVSGIIISDARNYNGDHYLFHPTTKIAIPGFVLPQWDQALQLIRNMALHIPGTTLISWDIAYSTDGWCMVEANDNGAWEILQSNLNIGLKEKLYRLMDRFFNQK